MKDIIKVSNLHKSFKTYETKGKGLFGSLRRTHKISKALNGVSLSIKQGEIVALVGRNGSGKSTLIKTITGILHPDVGIVKTLDFDPWKDRKKLALQIGVVFGSTHPQLYWNLPPIDTFNYIKGIYGINDKDYEKRLKYFIKMLNLKDSYKKQTRQLSLGERMKCEMVAAMLYLPPLVVMDEPTIGVDLPARIAIKKMILQMRKDYGMTFLITTHVVEDITNVDRIIMLDKGKVIFKGSQEHMRRTLAKNLILELYFNLNVDPKPLIAHGKLIQLKPGYAKLEILPRMLKEKWVTKLITSKKIIEYRLSEPSLSTIMARFYLKIENKKRKKEISDYNE